MKSRNGNDVLVHLLPGQDFPSLTRLLFQGRALVFVFPTVALIGGALVLRRGNIAGALLYAGTMAVTCMILSLLIGLAIFENCQSAKIVRRSTGQTAR